MKYRNLYFIVLTSIFKSCVMLSCYDCFSCPYIKDYITVFECKKGESCLTIVMAGETFQDGYSTVVHRQCQRGDMSWDGTPLGIDWYYWAESYCSSHHSEIAQVDICLAIHCETDLCNNLPVENLTMTTVTASTTGTTSITGNSNYYIVNSKCIKLHYKLWH